jgi:hypothetical protein
MRRRRHKLEVSTFPFLAVLLCAMGSLILLLLVLDRRAKAAARERAYKAAEQVAAEELRIADERRQEWEKRRHALHAELVEQEGKLIGRINAVEKQSAATQAELSADQKRKQQERERLHHEQEQIVRLEEAVRARRDELERSNQKSQNSSQEMRRLSSELRGLERTLEDLKALRARQQQTYSVVPYRGKHGDNRAPLYLECAPSGLIFHPDRKTIVVPRLAGDEIKAEVRGRIVQQRVALKAAGRTPDDRPYLLMLVRPDGIATYYQTLHALNGLDLDFGYELIDADWALEFPADGEISKAKPWMVAEKEQTKPGPGSTSLQPPPVGINRKSQGPIWSGPSANGNGSMATGAGVSGGSGSDRGSGTGTNPAATGAAGLRGGLAQQPGGSGGQGAGASSGDGPRRESGSSTTTTSMAGLRGGLATQPALSGGQGGSAIHTLPSGAWQPTAAGGGPASNGASNPQGANTGDIAATPALPGQTGHPSGGIPSTPIMTGRTPAIPSAGSGSNSSSIQGPASPTSGQTGTVGGGLESPSATAATSPDPTGTGGSRNPAGGETTGGTGTAASGGEPHSPTPLPASDHSAVSKGSDGGSSPSDAAEGQPGSNHGGAQRRPPQTLDNDLVKPKRPARRTELRPAILGGDRDYIIMLECRASSVVLYPYGNSFSAESLAAKNGGGVLLQEAIKRMIARKQASVRPGEQPYRPQVRFMVRPDGLRSMHRAYPLLEELHIPLTRQNLDADEDVRSGD